jgi:hypothetical protein
VKTNFFSTFPPGQERTEFLDDFLFLVRLGREKAETFLRVMPEFLKPTETETDKNANRLATDLGIEVYQAESLLRWTKHILDYRQRRVAPEDTPTEWAEDLVTLLSESQLGASVDAEMTRKLALEAAIQIFKAAEDLRPQYLRQLFARGILPKFDHIDTTVELRGIIDKGFLDSAENRDELQVSNYNPRVMDLVEVASVHIRTDTDEHYYFQMTEQDLSSAIRSLTATLHELHALRASVSIGKKG